MELTPDAVRVIIVDSLFNNDEIPSDGSLPKDAVLVDGVTKKFGFHKERLEYHRDEIKELLLELPDSFMKSKGGGMSFLNAHVDKHGNPWGQHVEMEALFVLGMAVGLVKNPMPESMRKEMASILPGGVPYYVVDDS